MAGAGDDLQPGARDSGGERLGVGERRLLVVLADQHERRRRDLAEAVGDVVRRQELDGRAQSARRDARHRRRGLCERARVGPGRHDRAQDGLGHARGRLAGIERVEPKAHPGRGIRAVEPERGARVEQRERAHAAGVAKRRVERDLPSHGEPGEMRPLGSQRGDQRGDGIGQASEREPAGECRGGPVARHVPGDAAVARGKLRELRIEARARRPESVQEHHERPGARLAPGDRRCVDVVRLRHGGDLRALRRGRSGPAARGRPRRSTAA